MQNAVKVAIRRERVVLFRCAILGRARTGPPFVTIVQGVESSSFLVVARRFWELKDWVFNQRSRDKGVGVCRYVQLGKPSRVGGFVRAETPPRC
jgi:hypothetical protein